MSIFLETDRLILKAPELTDFDNLFALRSDADVMRYIGNGKTQTKEEVEKFLTFAIPYHEKHGISFCSVFEKTSSQFIGQAGLFYVGGYNEVKPDVEIAYRLHKQYWGRGYATELVKALIYWGFEHLPVDKLIAITHPENIASQNVLKKAGLDFQGQTKWDNFEKVYLYEIYRNDSIELSPYDNRWPKLAALEMAALREALPAQHIFDIQHLGSTAIPNIKAKPIIDIQIAVYSLSAIKQIAINALKKLGYVYWEENPDPERMFFVKGMPPFSEKRTHHVHIVEPTSSHWQGKIKFRDYLIQHQEAAHEYEILKERLAKLYPYDRERYTEAKADFVNKILKKASR